MSTALVIRWLQYQFCAVAMIVFGATTATAEPISKASLRLRAACVDAQVNEFDTDLVAVIKVLESSAKRYATSASSEDQCEQVLVGWIDARAEADELVQSLHAFAFYLTMTLRGSVGRPPFAAGASGSARRSVISAFIGALQKRQSPVAQAALLLCTELDDPVLAASAQHASYKQLSEYPWMVDPQWASWIVSGTSPGLQKDQGELLHAREALKRINFRAPYRNAYGLPLLYELSRFTLTPMPEPWKLGSENSYEFKDLFDTVWSIGRQSRSTLGLVNDRMSLRDGALRQVHQAGTAYRIDVGELVWRAGNILPPFLDTIDMQTMSNDEASRAQTENVAARLELERRSIALLAVWRASRLSPDTAGSATLLNVDETLDRLSAIPHRDIVNTEIVQRLDIRTYDDANKGLAEAADTCKIIRSELTHRVVAFKAGLYAEDFNVDCADGRRYRHVAIDQIPAAFLVAWKRHPRLFDMLQVSLTARKADRIEEGRPISLLELVQGVPDRAIPAMMAVLRAPGVPEKFIREYMLLGYQPDYGWMYPTKRPLPALGQMVKKGNVAADEAAYHFYRDWLVERYRDEMFWVAKSRLATGLRQIADPMPSSKWGCDTVGGGTSCGNRYNTIKYLIDDHANQLVAEANAILKKMNTHYLYSVVENLKECKASPRSGSYKIDILFHPNLSFYIARHQWTDAVSSATCDFAIEAEMRDPKMVEVLRAAFKHDPYALVRYNADVLPTSSDSGLRTAAALGAASHSQESFAAALQLLQASGLLARHDLLRYFYCPSVMPTLSNQRKFVPIRHDWFLRTPDGLDYFQQSDVLNTICRFLDPSVLQYSKDEEMLTQTMISEPFRLELIKQRAGERIVSEQAADKILADVRHQADAQKTNWSVGISIGSGAIGKYGILSFSINGFGVSLNVKLPDLRVEMISSAWRNIPIYRYSQTQRRGTDPMPMLSNQELTKVGGESLATPLDLTWKRAPIVEWTPGELNNTDPKNQALFVGLLRRADFALTSAEFQKMSDGLKLPVFSKELAQTLFEKSYEGIQRKKVLAKEWYPTSLDPRLLPLRQHGLPCPSSGCIDEADAGAIHRYIDDYNAAELARYSTDLASIKTGSASGKVLESDVAAIALTYSTDFHVMVVTYNWPVKGRASPLTYRVMFDVPALLKERVQKDPYGHQFEKWTTAIAASFAAPPNVPDFAMKSASEPLAAELGGQMAEIRKMILDPTVRSFVADLEKVWSKFWSDWTTHANNELRAGVDGGFVEPFVPEPLATPMLRFFEPPWQNAWERNMTIEDWLIYKNGNSFRRDLDGSSPIMCPSCRK